MAAKAKNFDEVFEEVKDIDIDDELYVVPFDDDEYIDSEEIDNFED